jgi:hypothetical protein
MTRTTTLPAAPPRALPLYIAVPLLLACLLVAAGAHAATPAGQVVSLSGRVQAVSERGVARSLNEGLGVFSGEEIRTGDDSNVSLRFRDGSKFELGEESTMQVDRFVYEQGADDAITTRIIKGAFRFVSGLIARRQPRSMSVLLPVVTIGIRGTNVAGEATATTATVILLEPEEADTSTAIEVSNQFGSVTIDEPGFGTDVPDAQSPPSPPRRMQLRTIQNIIRNIQTIQRIRVPRPVMR